MIVGKRALPALGVAGAAPSVALLAAARRHRDRLRRRPRWPDGRRGARGRGCLTVAFAALGAEWELVPPTADPFVAQELVETAYHVLWELVHVFFEHRGLLRGPRRGRAHDPAPSSFLYPFLAEREDDLDAVLADVRASVLAKAEEVGRAARATVAEAARRARRGRGRRCARASTRAARCWRSATAARRPTRWTLVADLRSRRRRAAGRRAARST